MYLCDVLIRSSLLFIKFLYVIHFLLVYNFFIIHLLYLYINCIFNICIYLNTKIPQQHTSYQGLCSKYCQILTERCICCTKKLLYNIGACFDDVIQCRLRSAVMLRVIASRASIPSHKTFLKGFCMHLISEQVRL